MKVSYSLSYSLLSALRRADASPDLINRLDRGDGTADDMRAAADLFEQRGDAVCAGAVRDIIVSDEVVL